MESLTPMMQQYQDIKSRYPDEVVFFRLGDFYEMFGEDAKRASKILSITLTQRNNIPMCGVPHHARKAYIVKLLKEGLKVVICEQLEEAQDEKKSLIKRGVTEILTPGTLVDEDLVEQVNEGRSNYIASMYSEEVPGKKELYYLSLACLDVSTGEFFVYYEQVEDLLQGAVDMLSKRAVSELLLQDDCKENAEFLRVLDIYAPQSVRNFLPVHYFVVDAASLLKDFFCVANLKGFGIDASVPSSALRACAALISYLRALRLQGLAHVTRIHVIRPGKYLQMNESTLRHLELFPMHSLRVRCKDSLYGLMNVCVNAMGSRLLKKWMCEVLVDIREIQRRHEYVGFFLTQQSLVLRIRELLGDIIDVERIFGKFALHKVSSRDVGMLGNSLESVETLKELLGAHAFLSEHLQAYPELSEIRELIERAIDTDSGALQSGTSIRRGYSQELDALKDLRNDTQAHILRLQEQERKKLNIPLKVKYNKMIGYFLEVSHAHVHSLPQSYIRKQSLVNVSRYTSTELSEYETHLLEAHQNIVDMEAGLFADVCRVIASYLPQLKELCAALSTLDVLSSFALLAFQYGYCQPVMLEEGDLLIQKGRHPVVEQSLAEHFIANDLHLSTSDARASIITGPNMSGKSTYLRQTALIVVMAQMGSFVPAYSAQISLCDRIFTRIGASDNLSRGESTFLVEMLETAFILNNATEHSLIIMDEVGRGTSTYDGLSIAWAVLEYLTRPDVNMGKILFATHYHELSVLSKRKGIVNAQFLIQEKNNSILFLHKVTPGISHRSYGVQIARLAGLPESVIQRSSEILSGLQSSHTSKSEQLSRELSFRDPQLSLFDTSPQQLVGLLMSIDPNSQALRDDVLALQSYVSSLCGGVSL